MKDEIIKELEQQYGIECDANFDPNILCDGDTCRNTECECWNHLKSEVEKHLLLQVRLHGVKTVLARRPTSTTKDTPPIDAEILCLVCAYIKPWGIFDNSTGAAVCKDCREC